VNHLYQNEPALYENDFEWTGFSWIDANDNDNSVFSFLRRAKSSDEFIVVISNFTPIPRENYRLGVPQPGYYRELLNSDAEAYWGSNLGNEGGVHTEDIPYHAHPHSLSLTLPPLSTMMLKLKA
jgi:1,4-alpha-glucan branching enzyme